MEKFDILYFEEHFKEGICVFENDDMVVSMYEWDDSYSIQSEQPSPSMLCSMKRYFVDTLSLKEEGLYLKKGFTKIGVWKNYDIDGNVVDTIDYDYGWNITWKKLVPIILEQGIKLGGIISITRQELNNEAGESIEAKRIWIIRQITFSDGKFEFCFDGDSGRLIEKKQISTLHS